MVSVGIIRKNGKTVVNSLILMQNSHSLLNPIEVRAFHQWIVDKKLLIPDHSQKKCSCMVSNFGLKPTSQPTYVWYSINTVRMHQCIMSFRETVFMPLMLSGCIWHWKICANYEYACAHMNLICLSFQIHQVYVMQFLNNLINVQLRVEKKKQNW